MIKANPSLGEINKVVPAEWGEFGIDGPMTEGYFINSMKNFFMTDPISRASATMAACTEESLKKEAASNGND